MLAEYMMLNVKSHMARQRKGAAVLETVLLIVMALVIVGVLITFFVGGGATDSTSFIGRIKAGFEKIFKLMP
ncbi:MAG: hypothetical protein NTV26_07175 [Caldiserica bacterium]|nr:hypothetical protein [Caldisericota bacterium]